MRFFNSLLEDGDLKAATTCESEAHMGNGIQWQSDFEAGRERAAREHKHVLLDFFNPQ
ncbi:MAG: thioredoxin family protein [Acidobacteriales bacterium]|nr:thioredoxin family protein [Terriglobales bacterium]